MRLPKKSNESDINCGSREPGDRQMSVVHTRKKERSCMRIGSEIGAEKYIDIHVQSARQFFIFDSSSILLLHITPCMSQDHLKLLLSYRYHCCTMMNEMMNNKNVLVHLYVHVYIIYYYVCMYMYIILRTATQLYDVQLTYICILAYVYGT